MTLIIDGKPYITDKVVKHNLVFHPGDKNTSKQKKKKTWAGLGIHWTGGEGDSERVIRTLKARGLSVQFIVEKDGTIVQTADLMTRCAHIGTPGNDRFLGVETVCRGFATKEDLAKAKLEDPTLRDRDELDWDEQRDTYSDTIGGKSVRMASFGPQQVESLVWLSETLAGRFGFPRQIPAREVTSLVTEFRNSGPVAFSKYVVPHEGKLWLPAFDRKPARFLSRASNYKGVLGHFHIHKTKYDPGTEVFYKLWTEGWNPAGQKLTGVT